MTGRRDEGSEPLCIVVMGVCGTGKTTLAVQLAKRLGWPYAEADDFHPQANIDKMASGQPLNDDDRWPWLRALRDWIGEQAATGHSTLVTCSALKRAYRDVLRQARARVCFVELDLDEEDLRERMAQRDHFMPVSLLRSQLDTLEPLDADEDGFRLLSNASPEELADIVLKRLR
ncbi:gluconokinase [Bifidobacterium sp. ESL0763]|uniref:gluconokinase n=1 Tax=Bifidobacterium sp. ESL0763 TaxID=2983227 RepID=UPI0023F85E1A|nr:gluconokinase [Bifidobacterium sp. ESL0763]MDF7664385.1 gluconokinase [Bifidobacterium sp. ESL0763]